jgi:thiol-disulfide isomerase/thioredoxin
MKVKLAFAMLCAACLFAASCATDKHTIIFEIKGLGNDTIMVEYFPVSKYGGDENPVTDTLISVNGKFHYDLKTDENVVITLTPVNLSKTGTDEYYPTAARYMFLIVEPDDCLKVTGQVIDSVYLDYRVKGSALMSDYTKVRDSCTVQNRLNDSLIIQMNYYMFSNLYPNLPEKYRDITMEQRDSTIYAMRAKRSETYAEIRRKELSYIKSHLNTDLAAYFLLSQPIDTFAVYYGHLQETVKAGPFAGNLTRRHLNSLRYAISKQAKETIVKGATAPDFTLKAIDGEDFTLSSLKDKYLVLDFWGSWCGFCIQGFPKMKEYYEQYKSKAEFIGVDCRDSEDKWRKAVKDNEINWLHVIDDDSSDVTRNVAAKYAIEGYPTKIILDKDLKIIEIFIGESDAFYEKLDELLK